MMDTVNQVVSYLRQYPELVAVICGMVANVGLVGSLEAVIPPELPPWKQRLITLVAGFVVAVGVSMLVWWGLAPTDRAAVNLGVSITAGLVAPTAYALAMRVLSKFFPWLTAWAAPPRDGK